MHHNFISVQTLTLKLKPCPLPASISRCVTLTTPEHAIVSTIGCHTPTQNPAAFFARNRPVVFCKLVYAQGKRYSQTAPSNYAQYLSSLQVRSMHNDTHKHQRFSS